MDCSDIILSNDTYEIIVTADEADEPAAEPICIQPVNSKYAIWYFDRNEVPPLSLENYTYSAIPKCFGLLDSTSLETSGIIRLQNQPTLSLRGQGVFVAIIDTGVVITDDAFRNSDGTTRIFSYWDQTGEGFAGNRGDGGPPEGFLYGVEYRREQINEVLQNPNTQTAIPYPEEFRHGTFLASVACGSEDVDADFVGAAPYAEIIVVRLKPAKQHLKDFFYVPQDAITYAESDIMTAISYVESVAKKQDRPLVIFLGLGTNNGSHAGTSYICDYINTLATYRHRAFVVASGNEANKRHHYFDQTESLLNPVKVEINVENDMLGFYAELWSPSPELFAVSVQSPTGEIVPRSIPTITGTQTYNFIFEGTELTINYRNAGRTRQDQLIYLDFKNVVSGIWTINVYPQILINGSFHIWLPMSGMLNGDVVFLSPDPNTTLTMPSDATVPMTVGGYEAENGSIFLESGRGFDALGRVKPDFLAPAVLVQGKGVVNNYITYTGTSAAAAITAGACAQILEWAVIRENAIGINSVDIKNFLIRGCRRESEQLYPSPQLGYGQLDVYQSFLELR